MVQWASDSAAPKGAKGKQMSFLPRKALPATTRKTIEAKAVELQCQCIPNLDSLLCCLDVFAVGDFDNFDDFVFEHRSGCCATEPGYAGDIGAIEI